MPETTASRTEVLEIAKLRPVWAWWRAGEQWSRGRLQPDDDSERAACAVDQHEVVIDWSDIVALEAVDGHFHVAFANALGETRDVPLLQNALRCFVGCISDDVRAGCLELSESDQAAVRKAAFDALRTGNGPLRAAVLMLGLFGDETDALALGDYIQGYAADFDWPATYALEALRLMERRDAHMQIQRATFQAARPQTITAAQSRLVHIASNLRVPVWEVQDELVPTCGLDSQGGVALDYGAREFELELNRHLTPMVVEKPGWARHAQLPPVGENDELSLAADANSRWAVIRGQLLEAIPVQVRRLEEALAQEVRWAPDVWERRIRQHPLLVHLVPRAVWGVYVRRGRRLVDTFRVTADRELWGSNDEPYSLTQAECSIGLVHPLELTPELAAAWGEQLADYEVATMFPQIDRSVYRPESGKDKTVEFSITAPLNQALTLLHRGGWAEPGGRDIRKVFRKHDIAAYLRYRADGDQLVASAVSFGRHLDYPASDLALWDVPKIVYSEAIYEVEMLRGSQHTGGWAAVTI